MMHSRRVLFSIVILVTMAALFAVTRRGLFHTSSREAHRNPISREDRSGIILSPGKDKAIFLSDEAGTQRVSLLTPSKNTRRVLGRLRPGETARNFVWSPDGRLVAFETYSRAGHSPMTTTHVWVADSEAGDLKEVHLPPPNTRFSTYLDRWITAGTLRIRSSLLEYPEDVFYVYVCDTGEVEGPLWK